MTTDTARPPTIEDAVSALTPYLKPGFVEEWRRLTFALGYGRLGRTLCAVTIPAEPSTNGHVTPTRTASPPRRQSQELCPWGRKVSKSGNVTRNTRHNCGPECAWTYREALDWAARTPTHTRGAATTLSVLTGCASCLCGLPLHSHCVPASLAGRLVGMRYEKCDFRSREPVAPELARVAA